MPLTASGVVTWVPDVCPDGRVPHASADSANYQDAQDFDVTNSEYYQKLIPNVIAGIVLGVLGLLGFLFFMIYMLMLCCRRRKKLAQPPDPAQAQFLSSATFTSSVYVAAPPDSTPGRKFNWRRFWRRFWKWGILVMGLVCLGFCTWGAVESINESNHTISDFWDVLHAVQDVVGHAKADISSIGLGMDDVISTLEMFAMEAASVTDSLIAHGANSTVVNKLASMAPSLPDKLRGFLNGTREAIAVVGNNIYNSLVDLESKFEPPSLAFQEKWRFVPIIVLFITGAVLSLVLTPICWYMRFAKVAAFLVGVLWLNNALLMLLGAGLLNGVYVVSGDACLYAETFVMNFALRRVTSYPETHTILQNAFLYYFNATDFADNIVVQSVTGMDLYSINQTLMSMPPLGQLVEALNTTTLRNSTGLVSNNTLSLLSLVGNLNGTLLTALDLLNLTRRASIDPLYHQAKTFLCCSLNNTAQTLWAVWTAAGALTFVFAVLCTARLISHTFSIRKRQKLRVAAEEDGIDGAGPPVPADGPADGMVSDDAAAADQKKGAL